MLLFAFVTCRLVGNGFLSKPPGNGYLLKQSICSPPLQGPSTNIDLSEKRSLLSPKWVCLTAVLIQSMRTKIYFDIIEKTKRVLQEGRGPDGLRKDNFICQLLVCQRNAVLGGGNAMQLPKWRKRQKLRICPTEGVSKDCKGKAGWCCLHNVHRTQRQLHKHYPFEKKILPLNV